MSKQLSASSKAKVSQLKTSHELTQADLSLISGGIVSQPTWPPVVRPSSNNTTKLESK